MITNKKLWNWSSELIQDLFLDVLNGNITVEEAKEMITRKDEQDDNNQHTRRSITQVL